eukprot:TRINITY_DN7630_c0_g1_i1.p1 TRINITY_DN7630_c0_g1~~TRINITY_DN7630_c0_g1_i1.p1  ORF type:complete len:289 (+),score=94.22 TRINITY_DN7630_c0_g1_i1:61-927(+)
MSNCRFYQEQFPEEEQLVIVKVEKVEEMGAYVTLPEYGGLSGMILLSEISRGRIRSINKLIRVGREEAAIALRVDEEKGYIDLSKSRVSLEETQKAFARYNKAKSVQSILRDISGKHGLELSEMCSMISWPLYKRYGHAYDAFKAVLRDPVAVFKGLEIPEEVLADLIKVIERKMTPEPRRIRGDIEVTCFGFQGVDAVKAALKTAEECSTEHVKLEAKLVAPPRYFLQTVVLDATEGIEVMNAAIKKCKEVMESSYGGSVTVVEEPHETNIDERDAQLTLTVDSDDE